MKAHEFIDSLRRRKVGQWALGYLAGAWILLQVVDLIGGQFDWPATIGRSLTVLAGFGLIAAVIAAWFHGERGKQRARPRELVLYGLVSAFAVAGVAIAHTSGGARSRADAIEHASIAVLPFADLSEGKDQAFFADGITEEILNVLADIPQLRVAGRSSSFRFDADDIATDSLGRALHVAHLLTGSVRTSGDSLRITARLIDAASGEQVWTQKYDRKRTDIFAVQDEISEAIVTALQIRLTAPMPTQERAASMEAHEFYLRGLEHWRKRNVEDLRLAASFFNRAVDSDPEYARAHSGLALAYAVLPQYDADVNADSISTLSIAASRRALELDPESAEAHAALGQIALYANDPDTGEREARESVRLGPGFATAHQWLAEVLYFQGDFEEARKSAERAVHFDPLSAVARGVYAQALEYAGDYEGALVAWNRAIELDPEQGRAYSNPALLAIYLKRYDLARDYRRRGKFIAGDTSSSDPFMDAIEDSTARPVMLSALANARAADPSEAGYYPWFEMLGQRDTALMLGNMILKNGGPREIFDFRSMMGVSALRGLATDPRLPPALRPYRQGSPNR